MVRTMESVSTDLSFSTNWVTVLHSSARNFKSASLYLVAEGIIESQGIIWEFNRCHSLSSDNWLPIHNDWPYILSYNAS